jgi:flagellar biosynthesis protein FliR
MIRDLRDAARRTRVLAFFVTLAWFFGMTPPVGSRILLAVLAAAAIAADVFLDDYKARVPRPRYEPAA